MIERIFQGSRFLVWVAVATTAVSAVLLYGVSLNTMARILLDLVHEVPNTADASKSLAVKLLKLLDLLFIAISFQLIAVSLYRLFIGTSNKATTLGPLEADSFHDLKKTLIQVSVVILVILFLEHAVEVGATLETLYLGAAISLVTFSAILAWKNMK
ncbi:YqhA family protein [Stutzerimonas marianensis]|uniref:YqhA family protein n=1 Tax=Stutzerimonas marianensis TaxID=2929513 RepID=A0A9X1W1K4_9GAMM|nr:YqhA family protein [Pseudomonas marianensis]MCJ0972748.1 YqhA family protein [Pseudomonas marianensis]